MRYIYEQADQSGNHGPIHHQHMPGTVELPDALVQTYLDNMGFVSIEIKEGVVTALEPNAEALDAYLAEHPDTPNEPQPTEQDKLEAQVMYTALMTDTLLEEEE